MTSGASWLSRVPEKSRQSAEDGSFTVGLHDHFAGTDVSACEDVVAERGQPCLETWPVEMRDVLVGVATRRQAAVRPLDDAPEAAAVVRCPEHQCPAWFQDTREF